MKEIICTACNLPMQYQGKKENNFVWQCFKCESKFIGVREPNDLIDLD
jgi:ribosomal protein L37AE/L43A